MIYVILFDGGSSNWRLGCRWWHPGLSLWQLRGCRVDDLRFSVTVLAYDISRCVCVILFANEFHVNLSNKRLLNLNLNLISMRPGDAYMRHCTGSQSTEVMAWCLIGSKPWKICVYIWICVHVLLNIHTWKIMMSTCKMIMYTCNITISTCKILLYTNILNYVYIR